MSANSTLSISVLSGKGGVGKSNLALNICFGLQQIGHSVLLMDCDMGLANMDVLLGITPQKHMQDILMEHQIPEGVIVPVTQKGSPFDLIPANSGMAEFIDLDSGALGILRAQINPLAERYSFMCLDIGAGISSTAMGFGVMTALRLVVVTPEPTSLTDSYAMMKVISSQYDVRDFHIIVNQVESPLEGKQTYTRLATVCERFLNFTPTFLGEIRSDRALPEAVRRQKPLMELAPRSPAAVDCMTIANRLNKIRETRIKQNSLAEPLQQVRYFGMDR
jgi:flagellar biosynthesis protein FlhG